MSTTLKVTLISILSGVLTAAGQWYHEPTHFCFTVDCIKEFVAHLIPVLTTGLVGLLTPFRVGSVDDRRG